MVLSYTCCVSFFVLLFCGQLWLPVKKEVATISRGPKQTGAVLSSCSVSKKVVSTEPT